MFLPSSIQILILHDLLSISSLSNLQILIHSWRHLQEYSPALYDIIVEIQHLITEERGAARIVRNAAAEQKRLEKRKAAELEDSSDDEDDSSDSASDSSLLETIEVLVKSTRSRGEPRSGSAEPWRSALTSVTNLKRPRRTPAPQASAAETAKDYGREYTQRKRGEK